MHPLLMDDDYLIGRLTTEAEMATPYCPYSLYPVRAAVATQQSADTLLFYHGANYEVVSFNQTMHAEHSAITAALNDRLRAYARIIEAVYVETRDGGMPCGHCRQIINEFAAKPNIPVFVRNTRTGELTKKMSAVLLPDAFDVDSLRGQAS